MHSVGKTPSKLSVQEQKQIVKLKVRNCCVRLRRFQLLPAIIKENTEKLNKSMTRMVGSNAALESSLTANKTTNRGPLKKRPIGGMPASAAATTTTAIKMKSKQTPVAATAAADDSTPITIAAGRSRRAIKPNPKYASEDIVTPKILKQTILNSGNSNKRNLRLSSNSSDDFYNSKSLAEPMENSDDDLDEKLGKVYKFVSKTTAGTDSDVELLTPMPIVQKRRPGRPRIHKLPEDSTMPSGSIAKLPTRTATSASASTPIANLRKQLVSSNSSGSMLMGNRKRKADDSDEDDNDSVQLVKRTIISSGGTKSNAQFTIAGSPYHRKVPLRAGAATSVTTLNGSKINTPNNSERMQNRAVGKSGIAGSAGANSNTLAPLTNAIRAAQLKKTSATSASGGTHVTKRLTFASSQSKYVRHTSPHATATTLASPASASAESAEDSSVLFAADVTDDMDSSGTFTIVNIKDIISQKGDALLNNRANLVAQPQKLDSLGKSRSGSGSSNSSSKMFGNDAAAKINRRKTQHSNILSDKPDPDRQKNAQVGKMTGLLKQRKPVQKILNHMLAGVSATNNASGNSKRQRSPSPVLTQVLHNADKPAPRILNSVVSKRTQPVKPVIKNLVDSADEDNASLSLSLYDDDDNDDDSIEMKSPVETKPDPKYVRNAVKPLYNPLPVRNAKLATLGGNENSSNASTSAKAAQLLSHSKMTTKTGASKMSTSNENVSITREGDKVIKRITCYETWYVVNVPVDESPRHVRNVLSMPMIRLANSLKDVALPSDSWTTRVMLQELSASILATSKLTLYTGDLSEYNIAEEDRAKYQPASIMFRRTVSDRRSTRMPYDRAVIFRNKTFFTNIEGKNVKLIDAPAVINTPEEVSILLNVVDMLTLDSPFVEPSVTMP